MMLFKQQKLLYKLKKLLFKQRNQINPKTLECGING